MQHTQPNIHVISGQESFRIDSEVSRLKSNYSSWHTVQFSDQFKLDTLLDCLNMNALFSKDQFIIIKNPWFFKKALSESEVSLLSEIINRVTQTNHQLIVVNYGSVDQRKKPILLLKKHATFLVFEPFKEWEQEKLFLWIKTYVKDRGKAIDNDALIALEQISNGSLKQLSQLIDTICLAMGNTTHISYHSVNAMSVSSNMSKFKLIESLQSGKINTILEIISVLTRNGEDPIALMGLIVSQIRLFIQILHFDASKVPHAKIAKTLGKNPYYIQKILKSLKTAYTLPSLTQWFVELAESDFLVKSGKLNPRHMIRQKCFHSLIIRPDGAMPKI
jgi:DNA polymerase-3 subunit delta